ncbi:MAG: hypothetical protein AAB316_18110 [Bacteroidota bacterium]
MEAFNEETYQLIEDFLTGNLSESAAAEVSRRLEQDPEFAKEVEFMKFLVAGKEVKKPVEVLLNFERHYRRSRLKVRFIRSVAAVAAMLGLVFLIDLVVRKHIIKTELQDTPIVTDTVAFQSEIPNDSVLRNATPPGVDLSSQETVSVETPTPPIVRKDSPAKDWKKDFDSRNGLTLLGDSEDENLQEAYSLMDAGNGKEALPLLEIYFANLPEGEDDFVLRIETAKIYLRENDPAKAQFHLEKVVSGDAIELLKAEAEYYLALKDRLAGDNPGARKRLEKLADDAPEFWKKKAAEALKSLPK